MARGAGRKGGGGGGGEASAGDATATTSDSASAHGNTNVQLFLQVRDRPSEECAGAGEGQRRGRAGGQARGRGRLRWPLRGLQAAFRKQKPGEAPHNDKGGGEAPAGVASAARSPSPPAAPTTAPATAPRRRPKPSRAAWPSLQAVDLSLGPPPPAPFRDYALAAGARSAVERPARSVHAPSLSSLLRLPPSAATHATRSASAAQGDAPRIRMCPPEMNLANKSEHSTSPLRMKRPLCPSSPPRTARQLSQPPVPKLFIRPACASWMQPPPSPPSTDGEVKQRNTAPSHDALPRGRTIHSEATNTQKVVSLASGHPIQESLQDLQSTREEDVSQTSEIGAISSDNFSSLQDNTETRQQDVDSSLSMDAIEHTDVSLPLLGDFSGTTQGSTGERTLESSNAQNTSSLLEGVGVSQTTIDIEVVEQTSSTISRLLTNGTSFLDSDDTTSKSRSKPTQSAIEYLESERNISGPNSSQTDQSRNESTDISVIITVSLNSPVLSSASRNVRSIHINNRKECEEELSPSPVVDPDQLLASDTDVSISNMPLHETMEHKELTPFSCSTSGYHTVLESSTKEIGESPNHTSEFQLGCQNIKVVSDCNPLNSHSQDCSSHTSKKDLQNNLELPQETVSEKFDECKSQLETSKPSSGEQEERIIHDNLSPVLNPCVDEFRKKNKPLNILNIDNQNGEIKNSDIKMINICSETNEEAKIPKMKKEFSKDKTVLSAKSHFSSPLKSLEEENTPELKKVPRTTEEVQDTENIRIIERKGSLSRSDVNSQTSWSLVQNNLKEVAPKQFLTDRPSLIKCEKFTQIFHKNLSACESCPENKINDGKFVRSIQNVFLEVNCVSKGEKGFSSSRTETKGSSHKEEQNIKIKDTLEKFGKRSFETSSYTYSSYSDSYLTSSTIELNIQLKEDDPSNLRKDNPLPVSNEDKLCTLKKGMTVNKTEISTFQDKVIFFESQKEHMKSKRKSVETIKNACTLSKDNLRISGKECVKKYVKPTRDRVTPNFSSHCSIKQHDTNSGKLSTKHVDLMPFPTKTVQYNIQDICKKSTENYNVHDDLLEVGDKKANHLHRRVKSSNLKGDSTNYIRHPHSKINGEVYTSQRNNGHVKHKICSQSPSLNNNGSNLRAASIHKAVAAPIMTQSSRVLDLHAARPLAAATEAGGDGRALSGDLKPEATLSALHSPRLAQAPKGCLQHRSRHYHSASADFGTNTTLEASRQAGRRPASSPHAPVACPSLYCSYVRSVRAWRPGPTPLTCPACGCSARPAPLRPAAHAACHAEDGSFADLCFAGCCPLVHLLRSPSPLRLQCSKCSQFLGTYDPDAGCIIPLPPTHAITRKSVLVTQTARQRPATAYQEQIPPKPQRMGLSARSSERRTNHVRSVPTVHYDGQNWNQGHKPATKPIPATPKNSRI